jgi:hypothetical protein
MSGDGRLGFEVVGNTDPLIDELRKGRREMEQFVKGGADARGNAAAAGTDKVTKELARERAAVEKHYAGVSRVVANARRELAGAVGSISVPGLGPIGGLLSIAGGAMAVKTAIADYTALANATQQLRLEAGATAERMSTLIGVAGDLGIGTEALSDAFRTLKTAMSTEDGQRQLQALGIAFQDAEGNARPVIDVFEDLQKRFAGATLDAGTLQVMQELIGRNYRDVIPLLQMTSSEYAIQAQRIRELGEVMDEAGIAKVKEYELTMREAQITTRQFGEVAVPIAVDALHGLGQVFDTVGTMWQKTWGPILRGEMPNLNIAQNWIDAIDEAQKRHDELVARIRASAQAIVRGGTSGGGGGGESLGFASQGNQAAAARAAAAAQQAAQDAMRERIQAIQEEGDKRRQELQRELESYDKVRDAAIRTIQDEEAAREKQHELAIRAIEDEGRARDTAFEASKRARDDEVASLRGQIDRTQELLDLEKDRQGIAEAQADLVRISSERVFRTQFASSAAYYSALGQQQERARQAEKKLAEAKTKLEQDENRQRIDARIKALEHEGELEQRAMDDYRRDSEDRIRKIRDQMDAEKERADAQVKHIQDEMKTQDEAFKDAINNVTLRTKTEVDELQKRLKALQDFAKGVANAAPGPWTAPWANWGTPPNPAGPVAGGNKGKGLGGSDTQGTGENVLTKDDLQTAAQIALGRRFATLADAAFGGVSELEGHWRAGDARLNFGDLLALYRTSPEGVLHALGPVAGGNRGAGLGQAHDFPHDLVFTEPVLMTGARSLANYGAIAMNGSERVTFHGVGGDRSSDGGRPIVVQLIANGRTLYETVVAPYLSDELESRRRRGR